MVDLMKSGLRWIGRVLTFAVVVLVVLPLMWLYLMTCRRSLSAKDRKTRIGLVYKLARLRIFQTIVLNTPETVHVLKGTGEEFAAVVRGIMGLVEFDAKSKDLFSFVTSVSLVKVGSDEDGTYVALVISDVPIGRILTVDQNGERETPILSHADLLDAAIGYFQPQARGSGNSFICRLPAESDHDRLAGVTAIANWLDRAAPEDQGLTDLKLKYGF